MKNKDEMLEEYDFRGKKGVRGKYHKAFKEGYTVRIYKDDGTFVEEYFASIEADVHKHFPNSEAVNKALRSLIPNQTV